TRAHHLRIEDNGWMKRLLAPDLELAEYARILGRLLGHYQPLESLLTASVPARQAHQVPGQRCKAAWLVDDLRQLGYREADLAHLPRIDTAELPALNSLPAAVGCLYVLEGASLGGTLIARHLARHLAVGPDNGGRFYHGDGSETGA